MPKIKVTGLNKLQKTLKDNVTMDDVKRVVRRNGAEMQKKIQSNADFHGHYEGDKFVIPSGTTKRSIGLEYTDNGLTAEVEPTTEYSPYLEYGTRFMDAQPFVRPGYNAQKEKFKKDMKKLTR